MITHKQQYINMGKSNLNEYRATLEFRGSNFHGILGPSPTCYGLSALRLTLCVPDGFDKYHISVYLCCHQMAQGKERCIIFSPSNMMTSSNGNIFRVTGPLCGEFTGPGEFPTQRPVTRSFDVYFDLRLNKRLSKQS